MESYIEYTMDSKVPMEPGLHGCMVIVMEEEELEDELVRDVTEVMTSLCARLYGRRSARRRAERAMEAAGAKSTR